MKAAFTPGSTFAGYRVDSLVGRGGMGVVYRATDLSLERPVALKLIAPELAEDKRFRDRFLREPKLAASIDHPNVIPIYEAGEHDGQLYLAMRFVEGRDLRTILKREGKLAPQRALDLLGQVAGALDAAHRRALVHRDVKPANVLLDEEDHVYLTDFGITKQLGGASTDTDRVVGTLDYLAPEQIRGDPVDGRTDCYALGCVLYECLAGTAPFRRATEAETLWAHMQEEPAALRGHPTLDPVLRKALAKDREDRYAKLRRADRRGRPRARPRAPGGPGARRCPRGAATAGCSWPPACCWPWRRWRRSWRPWAEMTRGRAPPQANGVAAIGAADTELASFTETQTAPSSLAVGEGAVWALSLQDRTVTRIDLDTKKAGAPDHAARRPHRHRNGRRRRLGARRATASRASTRARAGSPAPSRCRRATFAGDLAFLNWGFAQVAVGAGAVWAINPDRTVSRIDPASGRRVATIDVDAATIAAGREGVWFIGGEDTLSVTPIDPRTNRVGRSIRLGAQNLSAVAVGGGYVWASAEGDGLVWRIEPGPRPVSRTIDVGVGVTFLAYDDGAIWTANYSDGTVSRIDVKTDDVDATPSAPCRAWPPARGRHG